MKEVLTQNLKNFYRVVHSRQIVCKVQNIYHNFIFFTYWPKKAKGLPLQAFWNLKTLKLTYSPFNYWLFLVISHIHHVCLTKWFHSKNKTSTINSAPDIYFLDFLVSQIGHDRLISRYSDFYIELSQILEVFDSMLFWRFWGIVILNFDEILKSSFG